MTTYLNKEAVLGALDEEAQEIRVRESNLAEIGRLREELEKYMGAFALSNNTTLVELQEKVAAQATEIAEIYEKECPACGKALSEERAEARAETARLKGLIAQQNQELADLGKALHSALESSEGILKVFEDLPREKTHENCTGVVYGFKIDDVIKHLRAALRDPTQKAPDEPELFIYLRGCSGCSHGKPHSLNADCDNECDDLICTSYEKPESLKPTTVLKEPELFICPEAHVCKSMNSCIHGRPHNQRDDCQRPSPTKCHICSDCVPVKGPVPTSGTGTTPEGATVEQLPGMLDDEHSVCDACIFDSGIPSECGHDPEECKTIALGRAYLGMAKDIGDLTSRVDTLRSELQRLKNEQERYIIPVLITDLRERCTKLETSPKELQDTTKVQK
jgi:flagellar motility protein MotE (MotC chaperone)